MSIRDRLETPPVALSGTSPQSDSVPISDWIPGQHARKKPVKKKAATPIWFRASPIPLLLLDPDGGVLAVNPAAEKGLKNFVALQPGENWRRLLHASDVALDEKRLRLEDPVRVQESITDPQGGVSVAQITASRLRFRERWVWLASFHFAAPWQLENQRLGERLHLETLITSLSTHFINLTADRIDAGIQYALKTLASWAKADRLSILLFRDDPDFLERTHCWLAPDVKPVSELSKVVDLRKMPWIQQRMRGLHAINLPNFASFPPELASERENWKARGAHSMLLVPLLYRGQCLGYLSMESLSQERDWSETHVSTLRVAGELLINSLERKKADLALQEAKHKYLSIFEHSVEGIYQTTPDGKCLSANPALAILFGYRDSAELMDHFPDLETEIYTLAGRRNEFVTIMTRKGRVTGFESQVRRRDGRVIWISENARTVYAPDGSVAFFEGMVMDITQRKHMEERILHDALHDALTGLPNRSLFLERVGRALDRAVRRPGDLSAILLLDLDRFKMVNDSMGHTWGDLLLVELAQRFTRLLPAGGTLARLGGDEFGLLLEDIGGMEPAVALAERIQRELSEPMTIEGQEVYASSSIGIAIGTASYKAPEEVLRDADTALNRAKLNGKGCHAVFDASMHTKAVHLLRLETDLRKAIERHEFLLHYQPIVDLKDRRLIGFEALVRWKHPGKGQLVPPNDFIPLAEETGLILVLGKWVVEEAARQLRLWQDQFPLNPPLTMSVNISGRQLEDKDLANYIRKACKDARVNPSTLKLELTESALMRNPDAAVTVLRELRTDGFKLSLDDFGTGYSSLSYLHRFPFNTLKIDRSFVARLEDGNKEDEIIRVINAMAETLGMDVIAEGIESPAQMQHLLRHGVGFGQGYYFSRPMDVEAADRAMRAPACDWPKKLQTI